MEEYVNMIHPDDRQAMADAFVVQLSGNGQRSTNLSLSACAGETVLGNGLKGSLLILPTYLRASLSVSGNLLEYSGI